MISCFILRGLTLPAFLLVDMLLRIYKRFWLVATAFVAFLWRFHVFSLIQLVAAQMMISILLPESIFNARMSSNEMPFYLCTLVC